MLKASRFSCLMLILRDFKYGMVGGKIGKLTEIIPYRIAEYLGTRDGLKAGKMLAYE